MEEKRDIYGNVPKDIHGNPENKDIQGNVPKDIHGNTPKDIYGNEIGDKAS